jgi:hypothetical protein
MGEKITRKACFLRIVQFIRAAAARPYLPEMGGAVAFHTVGGNQLWSRCRMIVRFDQSRA